jgi:hypothetical protein
MFSICIVILLFILQYLSYQIEDRRKLGFIRASNADEEFHRLQRERELEMEKRQERIALINNVEGAKEASQDSMDEGSGNIATYKPSFGSTK